MGEIFLATHVDLNTQHAVKVIRSGLSDRAEVVDLFLREAAVLRTIRNDAIVAYDGVFRDEFDRLYLVMEFVAGPSLSELREAQTLTASEALGLMRHLSSGLAAAHESGVVHRDVSPDNIILSDGRLDGAKIIDFGIAKLTDPTKETIIGTGFAGKFGYASPEQLGLCGGQVDERSDIYSLALTILSTLEPAPVVSSNYADILETRKSVPELGHVKASLKRLLTAMLQPNPDDRPASMRDVMSIVDRKTMPEEIPPDDEGPIDDPKPKLSMRRGLAISIPFAVLVFGVFAYYQLFAPIDLKKTSNGTELNGNSIPTGPDKNRLVPSSDPAISDPTKLNPNYSKDDGTSEVVKSEGDGERGQQVKNIVDGLLPKKPTPTEKVVSQLPTPKPRIVLPDVVAEVQSMANNQLCSLVSVREIDNGIRLTGFVASIGERRLLLQKLAKLDGIDVDNQIYVEKWPFCEIKRVLAKSTSDLRLSNDPFDVSLNHADGIYREGEVLKVFVRGPTAAQAHLTIVFIDSEGGVVHLLPSPVAKTSDLSRGRGITLGSDGIYKADKPFGKNLLVAIQTPKALLKPGKDHVADWASFIGQLTESLDQMRGSTSVANIVSSTKTIVVHPK